jgi:flagellar motor switch protein FliN/FliY
MSEEPSGGPQEASNPAVHLSESPQRRQSSFEALDGGAMIERLLDAELEVALSFGGRQLMLKEILDLNPGSVVELDHHVQDPVDLRIGGKTIARGEVVVVEGNYGLRITEIVEQQRIDMLGTS